MINIENLDFFYDDKQVLFDLNLQLEKNTITGLIGPNGAGKSTLMRCISALEAPQNGSVLLDNVPILADPRNSFTKIGYLPDIFGLSEKLTVIQSWAYAASARGITNQYLENAINSTAKILNLEDKLNEKVANLSRGQKQRVGIGQVIIHRPEILILDEPASGLDPEARYELSQLFNQLRDQGMTLLVSSHILSELDEYCTHMIVLQNGRVTEHRALDRYNQFTDQNNQIALVVDFENLTEQDQMVIENAPHVKQLKIQNNQVTLSIQADPIYRTELIRYLVEHKLTLIGIAPLRESLLQSYRKSIEKGQ